MLLLPVFFWISFRHKSSRFAALGIAAESPQRGTSEDLQRKARPAKAGNAQKLKKQVIKEASENYGESDYLLLPKKISFAFNKENQP